MDVKRSLKIGKALKNGFIKKGEAMLYYTEAGLSPLEVPEEVSLCIYISGCVNHCEHCHYKQLQNYAYGDPLKDNIHSLLQVYEKYATCLCFLGEGDGLDASRKELVSYALLAKRAGMKTCLYSGRNIDIEEWMYSFDYVKIGSYVASLGGLLQKSTNQRLFKKIGHGRYVDITYRFWDEDNLF